MTDAGFHPDWKTFFYVIIAYLEHGYIAKVKSLLPQARSAIESEARFAPKLYSALIRKLAEFNQFDLAFDLLKDFFTCKVTPLVKSVRLIVESLLSRYFVTPLIQDPEMKKFIDNLMERQDLFNELTQEEWNMFRKVMAHALKTYKLSVLQQSKTNETSLETTQSEFEFDNEVGKDKNKYIDEDEDKDEDEDEDIDVDEDEDIDVDEDVDEDEEDLDEDNNKKA
jgi:hypothetical protein